MPTFKSFDLTLDNRA